MKGSAFSLLICATVTLLLGCLWCQTAPAQNDSAHPAAATPKRESPKSQLTPEQERGLRLLKAAEAEAAGLEPDMRAFVLWRASYAYKNIDTKKAEKLAADAFTATQAIDDPTDHDQCGPIGSVADIKSWIQERVLSDMIQKQKIAEAEELVPQATEPVRNRITKQLVQHYIQKKEFARAEGFLSQLADSADYPFDAAGELLVAMGPALSADRMTIFNQALNNFEEHSDKETMGQDDIGNFIEKTWAHVPSAMVLESVNKVLEAARSKESHSHYSMTSASGSVMLNSAYELRLFQLLPVLQELDKDKAEELLRDNAETKAKLAKYPQGMQSLTSQGNVYSYGISDLDAPQAASGVAQDQAQAQIRERVEQIIKESEKDPAQALTDALGLPAQANSYYSPRAEALVRIAESTVKKKPSVAKSALDEVPQDSRPVESS